MITPFSIRPAFIFFCSPFALRCRHAVRLRFSETLHNARSTYAHARAVLEWLDCRCFVKHALASRELAGRRGQREPREPEILFCFSPAPGGSDAKDAFQHAAFKGNRKEKTKAAQPKGKRCRDTGNQERNLNYDTGTPTRLSDEPHKKRPTAGPGTGCLFLKPYCTRAFWRCL